MDHMVVLTNGKNAVGFISNVNTKRFKEMYVSCIGLHSNCDIMLKRTYDVDSGLYILPYKVWEGLKSVGYCGGYDLPKDEEEARDIKLEFHHIVDMMRQLVKSVYPDFMYSEYIEYGIECEVERIIHLSYPIY